LRFTTAVAAAGSCFCFSVDINSPHRHQNISASSVPIIIIVIINYHESVFLLRKFPPSASLFSSEFLDLAVSIIHHQFVVEIH
jgi:hypothetical protein